MTILKLKTQADLRNYVLERSETINDIPLKVVSDLTGISVKEIIKFVTSDAASEKPRLRGTKLPGLFTFFDLFVICLLNANKSPRARHVAIIGGVIIK